MSAIRLALCTYPTLGLSYSPIDMEVVLVLRGTTRPLTGREVSRLVRVGSLARVA